MSLCNIAVACGIRVHAFVLIFTLITAFNSAPGNQLMSLATAIAIYFIIWWVVLFAVLPWGVRSQEEGGDVVSGSDPGAPVVPRLWWKLLWTTVAVGIIYAIAAVVYVNRWVTLEGLSGLFGAAS